MENILIYENKKADSTKVWLLFLFLGWSYGSLGKMGTQILFYCTAGGFGVWALFRLFNLSKSIKTYNKKQAIDSGLSTEQMLKLNLL